MQSRCKKTNLQKNNPPGNPAFPPNPLAVVLEVSADEGARVRRWAEQVRDASIQVEIQGSKLSLRGITPAELWCRVIMFETFGVTDSDLQSYLGRQVEQCFFNSALAESELQDRWAEIIRVARALLQGLAPRDSIEVQLAVQMIGDTLTVFINGKSVAQVIGSRSHTTAFGLQAGQLEQASESATCRLDRQPAVVGADEEACVNAR